MTIRSRRLRELINSEMSLSQSNHSTNLLLFPPEPLSKPRRKPAASPSCYDCRKHKPLTGYRFADDSAKLMPLCDDCRNERAAQIAGNRFERRMARRVTV